MEERNYMREILFRGKALTKPYGLVEQENGWVFGVPVPIKIDAYMTDRIEITQCHGYDELDYWDLLSEDEEVDPKTIGQYTGCKDKSGKKIFEGDIVKTKYGRRCIIEWHSSRKYCGWDMMPVGTVENILHTKAPDENDLWHFENLEVVGNIHDNPELLKGE